MTRNSMTSRPLVLAVVLLLATLPSPPAAAASRPPLGPPTPPRSAFGSPLDVAGGSVSPGSVSAVAGGYFPGGLLIADRRNRRLIVVDDAGNILWRFPASGSQPLAQTFAADDAFVSPDGKSIVASEEGKQVIVRIDIATQQIVWEYGTYGVAGSGPGQLSHPDDAYPLANGNILVADIRNCRILEIAPSKDIVQQWGTTGVCKDQPPTYLGHPNGDTPLPDGGMLVTEINRSRVVRLSATGDVVFDIHVPVHYPSDAQLMPNGDVLVVDWYRPGAIVIVDPTTDAVVFRYRRRRGPGRLNHPSIALPLANGMIVVSDDQRDRVVVIDPATKRIVWQYGHTGQPSAADGYLYVPDGLDVLPPGIFQ